MDPGIPPSPNPHHTAQSRRAPIATQIAGKLSPGSSGCQRPRSPRASNSGVNAAGLRAVTAGSLWALSPFRIDIRVTDTRSSGWHSGRHSADVGVAAVGCAAAGSDPPQPAPQLPPAAAIPERTVRTSAARTADSTSAHSALGRRDLLEKSRSILPWVGDAAAGHGAFSGRRGRARPAPLPALVSRSNPRVVAVLR